jgi:TetR/AcrR family transcriptional regulator
VPTLSTSPRSSPQNALEPDGVALHKRERRKDARPGELLAAALDLFVEKGFAGTRVEEVAQRAGVSKGTLFLYFASKEELFKAVVRENITAHYPQWHDQIRNFDGSTADMLHGCVQSWWASVGSTKASGISKLMVSEGSNFPELAAFYFQEAVAPGQELIRSIFERGIARGEFRAIDLKYGVHALIAQMLYLLLWKHSPAAALPPQARLSPPDYLRTQIDLLLHGLVKTHSSPSHLSGNSPS